ACSTLLQKESQRVVLKTVKEENEGIAMYGKGDVPVCGACGKKGHLKEKCWTMIGYPSWITEKTTKEKEDGTSFRGGRGGRETRGGRMQRGGGRSGNRMARNVQTSKEPPSSQNSREGSTSGNIQVTHKGDVKINNYLTLKGVLLVPSFKHNLMSVQRLARDDKCEVKFRIEYCMVMNEEGDIKAVGRAEKGLYLLMNRHYRR
ncbi:Serine/threonine-protein kinase CLA4, partial [Bienertia sinuspersici]